MYRTVALILALTVAFFVVRSGEEPMRALRTPEVRPAPEDPAQTLNLEAEDARTVTEQGAFVNATQVMESAG